MAELTKLGRYKLGRVLGRGAMGVVYEGLDPSLNRRVAIKTILKNAAIDDETARAYSAQFVREAQAAGRLNHPNIVQVHDFAEEDQIAYLVMEFIQGRELRGYFDAKEKFEPAEAVRIMGELLDALDFAHEAGVIHRDVKPANVMLDAQRRVKLADFGVARIQDSERSAAGTMVGTPAFMSPEQIQGGKIDRRTDLFSAGVVLYQLLTGEQPFTGAGAWTVAKKIMQDDPPRPSTVAVSVSPVFDEVVNKALAKKPADRFASAKEFAAALRGALAAGAQAADQIPPAAVPKPKAGAAPKASEAEVEFWRAIQNSTDPAEFEFYLEQFAEGTYAPLARHKIAKLKEPAETARKVAGEQARREAEAKEQAARETEARARREVDERAKQVAAEKGRREAAERAKWEAHEKAKREAEEKARQAQSLARLKQQEEGAARAKVVVDEDATAAIGSGRPAAMPPELPVEKKKSLAVAAIAAVVLIVAGAAGYLLIGRTPPSAPVAENPPVKKAELPVPAPAKPPAPVIDEEKIQREVEERVRREYADKSAAERAVAAKATAEKAMAEKLAAAKAAVEKSAAQKAATEKAAAERAAAEKAAVAEKEIAAKAAALETAAAERAATEKAAAEKAAAQETLRREALAAKQAAAGERKQSIADASRGYTHPGRPEELRNRSFFGVARGRNANWFVEIAFANLNPRVRELRFTDCRLCRNNTGRFRCAEVAIDGLRFKGQCGSAAVYLEGIFPNLEIVNAFGKAGGAKIVLLDQSLAEEFNAAKGKNAGLTTEEFLKLKR